MKRNEYVGETFDINDLYFKVFGYVAPPFPRLGNPIEQLPFANLLNIKERVEEVRKGFDGRPMRMPLTLTIPGGEELKFPTEPIVSLRGSNKIIRRYPNRAESGGSIKERWSSDDVSVSIKGIFIDMKNDEYPEALVRSLRKICEHQGALTVEDNPLFEIFGITRIVLSNYTIPFTPGWHAQGFELSGWSDVLFDSLLEEK